MELFNLLISSDLKSRLKLFSAKFNLRMAEVVRRAVEEFIDTHRDDVINADGEFVKKGEADA